ncbi:unnamed protein product, partial [Rotaria sp. Silwood2]
PHPYHQQQPHPKRQHRHLRLHQQPQQLSQQHSHLLPHRPQPPHQ